MSLPLRVIASGEKEVWAPETFPIGRRVCASGEGRCVRCDRRYVNSSFLMSFSSLTLNMLSQRLRCTLTLSSGTRSSGRSYNITSCRVVSNSRGSFVPIFFLRGIRDTSLFFAFSFFFLRQRQVLWILLLTKVILDTLCATLV
jgi:hypothetical protein